MKILPIFFPVCFQFIYHSTYLFLCIGLCNPEQRCLHSQISVKTTKTFNVLLTVHLSITLVNDQIDAQLLYFIIGLLSPLHVSTNVVLIIRKSNFINTASGIDTLKVHTCFQSDDTRCFINTI